MAELKVFRILAGHTRTHTTELMSAAALLVTHGLPMAAIMFILYPKEGAIHCTLVNLNTNHRLIFPFIIAEYTCAHARGK